MNALEILTKMAELTIELGETEIQEDALLRKSNQEIANLLKAMIARIIREE